MKHKMKTSQYLNDYLAGNRSRGNGNGLTIGSYLACVLRGKAKQYSAHYHRALENSLRRAMADGACRIGASRMGKTAYYPTSKA
jgi:hypothetical protein